MKMNDLVLFHKFEAVKNARCTCTYFLTIH